ncbi:MAG TPA: flagellar filament capping protein FliD [Terriglobales bacterium]|nr:flagellar filament capping protein FliD [Terriglobales bacterium]
MGISFNSSSLLSGNGINVSAVVQELQAAQSGQLTAWQSDLTTLQNQSSALSSINNDLSNLQAAVQEFSDPTGVLSQLTTNSSLPIVVSATAQSGATPASYTVVVNGLASAGTLYTDPVASASASILPSGQTTADLKIQIGGASGTTADIAITQGSNDTLTTLAQSINTASAKNNWGITATVVTDANGARLAIYSQSTGSPGALALSDNTTSLTFEPAVGGTDAEVTINGIPYASTTNTLAGAIPDVTFNLESADPATPVTVTVAPDSTAVNNAVDNFVTEYNTVIDDIKKQFTVNPSTNSEGPLGADSNLRLLQSSLLNDAAYTTGDSLSTSSGYSSLAALGISMNDDGTLTVNTATLDNAVTSNPAALTNFFTNSGNSGFANNFATDLNALTSATTGALNSDLAANQNQQNDLNTEISNFESRLAAQAVELTRVFDQVNANLEQYPFLLQQVTALLGSLGSSGTSSGILPSTNTTPTSGTASSTSGSGSGSSSGSSNSSSS